MSSQTQTKSNSDPNEEELFKPTDDDILPPGLDSGDVVLFNRRCSSMSIAGAALCYVSKIFSNSQWDHVGVVIRHPSTGELLFLEADFGGVKLRSLAKRVKKSKSNQIAIRRLSIVRTSSMREKFFAFASDMKGKGYQIGAGSVMIRVADPLAKKEIERLNAIKLKTDAEAEQLSRELQSAALTSMQRRLLEKARDRLHITSQEIYDRLLKEFEADSDSQKKSMYLGFTSKDLSRVFCSELVAAAYQRVGLMGSYPPPFHYTPQDFSSELHRFPGLQLLKSANLYPEEYLKGKPKNGKQAEKATERKSFRGVFEGDTPSRDSRNLIRDAIKRTPLYAMVPDEYKRSNLLKLFRARIVEKGDVVFEQGDYGHHLYVVGSGKVERFMSKYDEDPILVSTLGPKTSFGLTGLIYSSTPRVSTVRAKERTLLWELDNEAFESIHNVHADVTSIVSLADTVTLRGILQEHFLFKRLDTLGPKEMNAFFVVKFRAGEEIFRRGEAGDNFYIIKNGEVERHVQHPKPTKNGEEDRDRLENDRSLVKTLKPGQSFGELSLMYDAPRSSTVRAKSDTECWAISAESYHRLNLGGGTRHLRAVFEANSSVNQNGESYMTRDDMLKFAGIDDLPEKQQRRIGAHLVSLITSNRERDPITRRKRQARFLDQSSDEEKENIEHDDDDDEDEILMDFWEFVRFDIVLNQPDAERDLMFLLVNRNNSGFVSLEEMQNLLQDYADIDKHAREVLEKKEKLQRIFGKDGSHELNMKEFERKTMSLLPNLFEDDVKTLMDHMLNLDVDKLNKNKTHKEIGEVTFLEPPGSLSVIGSQFVSNPHKINSQKTREAEQTSVQIQSELQSRLPSWLSNIPWIHLVSLGLSGMISKTAVAPLERLKILMQTNPTKRFPDTLSGARKMIMKENSIRRAMFRGNSANIIRIVPGVAVQMWVVSNLTKLDLGERLLSQGKEPTGLQNAIYLNDNDEKMKPQPVSGGVRNKAIESIMIGGIAGMIGALAFYPFELLHGRLSIQRPGFEPYNGLWNGFGKVIRTEGIFSLYRGISPTIIGVFPYVGISFAMYETIRPILPVQADGSETPTYGSSIAAGAIASATGQVAAYPLDTCRRRLQVAGFDPKCEVGATSFIGTGKEIYQQMGWKGFFRGLTPNLLKGLPSVALSFIVYEQVRSGMKIAGDQIDRVLM